MHHSCCFDPSPFLTCRVLSHRNNPNLTPPLPPNQVSELIRALPLVCKADAISSALRKEKRDATAEEAAILAEAEAVRDHLIQVDVFDHATEREKGEGYVRPAIQGTEEMLSGNVREFKEFAMA